jgi:hypothetical protein
MSTSAISQSVGKAPCGCGCSGASSSAPCTCGGASCTTCQSQSFVRPEFFAGQLLTEDDLQSLINYVVAKNRLHARYLFGPGVVCGLKVKPDPCKCGQVIVEPGYALDCCGNDIAVSCPQTLDINQMISALMLKLRGGYDCGDPCAEQESADASTSTGANSGTGMSSWGNTGDSGNQSKIRPKHYCLYISYCEQDTDPVTPYATSTPCGQPVCQTTRVQEGFTFALRCPAKDCDYTPAICESLSCCQGDSKEARTIAADAAELQRITSPIALAARRMRDGMSFQFDGDALKHANQELERWMEDKDFDLARLRELARLARKDATEQSRSIGRGGPDMATNELSRAAEILKEDKSQFPTKLEQSYIEALVEVLEKHRDIYEKEIDERDIADLGLEIRFLQWGAVMTRELLKESLRVVHKVREWFLDRREQTGLASDPILEREEKYAPVEDWDVRAIERFGFTAADLAEKCLQFNRNCYCNALLPPCSSCTDTGVLLACVTVQDCCVKEICNLDREFVLTGPNLRYWFPEIQWLGCEIEKCCCSSHECERPTYSDLSYEEQGFNLCDAFYAVLQATCDDRKFSPALRMSRYRNLFSTVLAQAGMLAAERGVRSPIDPRWSEEIAQLREEIESLKKDSARLRKELRVEKKSKPPETQ